MNLPDAVKSCLRKYVTFSGRAPRSEYWFWVLAYAIILFILNLVAPGTPESPSLLGSLFAAFIVLPSISVGVRRLHDINKSGWWYWIVLIPLIGTIITIIWFCTKGTAGDNRFGPDPLGLVQ